MNTTMSEWLTEAQDHVHDAVHALYQIETILDDLDAYMDEEKVAEIRSDLSRAQDYLRDTPWGGFRQKSLDGLEQQSKEFREEEEGHRDGFKW